MSKSDRFWELLGKQTSGEATRKEQKELEILLGDDREIQYMVGMLDHYWEALNNLPDPLERFPDYPATAAYKLAGKEPVAESNRLSFWRKRRVWWAMAASVIILVGGWYFLDTYSSSGSEMNTVSTKSGSKTQLTLPDGTLVWLNAESTLSYSSDLQHAANREVALSGEAYFEVKHQSDRPFVIHTQYLDIKDLGTAFNVKAYPDDLEAEASLVSGSIEVSVREVPEKSFVLKPKEKIIYNATRKSLSFKEEEHATPSSENSVSVPMDSKGQKIEVTHLKNILAPSGDSIVVETAWIKNKLVFDGEKFSSLAKRLERWYDVKMKITNKEVANYRFSGIFDGETLEQALEELQMIRPFAFNVKKNRITISK